MICVDSVDIQIDSVFPENCSCSYSKKSLYSLMSAGAAIGQLMPADIFGLMAQWLEQGTHNPLVAGSNPAGPTIKKHHAIDSISVAFFFNV